MNVENRGFQRGRTALGKIRERIAERAARILKDEGYALAAGVMASHVVKAVEKAAYEEYCDRVELGEGGIIR